MRATEFDLDTTGRQVIDITDAVRSFCAECGDGLCNVFVPHATAGLAIIETDSGSEEDLGDLMERLIPKDHRYRHDHGTKGHGADHLTPTLFSPSLVVPVVAGKPALGTWQSIVVVDRNPDNAQRRLRLTFIGGTPGGD